MIRAIAVDKDTVHVEVISHDFRVVLQEKEALKDAIPCRDRYWDGKLKVWVVMRAQSYIHLWFVDHALRLAMKQLELV